MTYSDSLIEQYQSKGLLLDSNLLLLHLVGSINPALIGSSRLTSFTIRQMVFLQQFTAGFRRMVTTAHVLTEVSNLVNDLHAEGKKEIWSRFVSTLEMIEEQPYSSYEAARLPEFRYLGLTDTVLTAMSNDFLIVSNDGRMVNLLWERNLNALKWVDLLRDAGFL